MKYDMPREKALENDVLKQIANANEEELIKIHQHIMMYKLKEEYNPNTQASVDEKIKALDRRAKELNITLP